LHLCSCQKSSDLKLYADEDNAISTARLNSKLSNPSNPEDKKMNENLFLLAKAFTKIASHNDLMSIVYQQASLNSNNEVKYSELIAIDVRFKTILNTESGVICSAPLGTAPDPYKCIDDSMIYKGVDYFPNIYIPNFFHDPRMKYSNEWYHNSICEILVASNWLLGPNYTFSFGNAKCGAKIKRVQ
jgi:hypothetical protein